MKNLKITISYNGATYCGFQIQPDSITTPTIQGVCTEALTKLFKHEATVIGCGRTDAGVHAREYVFNTRTSLSIPNNGLVKALNGLLPHDIAVHTCETVDNDFHARYSAKSKEYAYLIHNGKTRNVFIQDLAYFYPRKLDFEKMRQAAELFMGEHDFSAYCKAESLEIVKAKEHGAVRQIYDFTVKYANEDCVELLVKGNGFLHNMVRILCGTLINVSEGKISLDDIRKTLSGGERKMAGVTLPACGLYLNKVVY